MTGSVRRALVTGIFGQDGSYLALRLSQLGYSVLGTTHRSDAPPTCRVLDREFPVLRVDLASTDEVDALVRNERPDDIFNLAARASSAQLFDDAIASAEINGVAVARFLEAIRRHSPGTRFCQASSREVFAGTDAPHVGGVEPFVAVNERQFTGSGDHVEIEQRGGHVATRSPLRADVCTRVLGRPESQPRCRIRGPRMS